MRSAQVVRCKCGVIIAAYIIPVCFEDKDWQNDIRDFKEKGYIIEELLCDGSWQIERCRCDNPYVHLFTKQEIRNAFLDYCDENGMFEDEANESADDFINNFLIRMRSENKRQLEINI